MDGNLVSELLRLLAIVSVISLTLALLVGLWVWRTVKKLRLPPDATFVQAMRLTPLSVVVLLDLLDLGLDFLSTPISWVILSRLGLQQLRGATAVEAIIPGTQAIPTMTLVWAAVRLFSPRLDEMPFLRETVEQRARRPLSELPPPRYRK